MAPPPADVAPGVFQHAFREPQPQAVAPARTPVTVDGQKGPSEYRETFIASPHVYKKDIEEKGSETQPAAKYQNYLPTWEGDQKYGPLQPFEHKEHGNDADAKFPNLLNAGAKIVDLTGNIGAEVHGVQLSSLNAAGQDELALLVAQKKVVAFRDQDFAELSIDKALEFGGYFGRHHIHPTSPAPAGFPEIHLVHRGAEDKTASTFFRDHTTSVRWHSDVTYENQPPGTTFLYLLDGPVAGGDTLFANLAEAYNRLSPAFQQRLHGLKAVHSAHEQANNSKLRGGVVRREAVTSEHPIVRTHPATGEKALFVNPQFTRKIVGLKEEESEYLLRFLFDHIARGGDFQARVKWAPNTVVVWDNRVTSHSALLDWDDGQRRHLARITPQAERPYETPFEQ